MSGENAVQRKVRRVDKRAKFTADDLAYAYECAADFLEAEEWTEDDGGAQVAAFREAERRIRNRAETIARRAQPNSKISGM
jgi:hypothetical protein